MIVVVVATPEAVRSWAESAGASYPLLADPGGEVTKNYGLYDAESGGLTKTVTLVLDADRRVMWSTSSGVPTADAMIEHLP